MACWPSGKEGHRCPDCCDLARLPLVACCVQAAFVWTQSCAGFAASSACCATSRGIWHFVRDLPSSASCTGSRRLSPLLCCRVGANAQDPMVRRRMWSVVNGLRPTTALVLSTHVMEEVPYSARPAPPPPRIAPFGPPGCACRLMRDTRGGIGPDFDVHSRGLAADTGASMLHACPCAHGPPVLSPRFFLCTPGGGALFPDRCPCEGAAGRLSTPTQHASSARRWRALTSKAHASPCWSRDGACFVVWVNVCGVRGGGKEKQPACSPRKRAHRPHPRVLHRPQQRTHLP